MQCVIEKENNFKEPGERYRSFTPERFFFFFFFLNDDDVQGIYMFLMLYGLVLTSGKNVSSVDGLKPYLTPASHMKSAASGSLTGLRYNICEIIR